MDSDESQSATLSPRSEALPVFEPQPLSLKRKIMPSLKGRTDLDTPSRKKVTKTKASDVTSVHQQALPPTIETVRHTLTPPTTPSRAPVAQKAAVTAVHEPITSTGALLDDIPNNPLSIHRFKGISPVLAAVNRGPLKLRFPETKNAELFVITGLLQSHDMTVIKEAVTTFSFLYLIARVQN
jgi:hypothetical protein